MRNVSNQSVSGNEYDVKELVELGYLPHLLPLLNDTKIPSDKGWSSATTAKSDLSRFGNSIGMRCEPNNGEQGLCVLDIDVLDEKLAAKIWADVENHYPGIPCRVGQPPKFAVVFRYEGEETTLPKWTIKIEGGHKIEVLGRGQQIVVAGIHPDTKRPYYWQQPLVHRDDLQLITKDQLQELIDDLIDGLDVVSDSRRDYQAETKERDLSHLDDATRNLVEAIYGCLAETNENILKELYRRENRLDYEDWFALIVAIRDTFKGTLLDAYALDALKDFTGRWTDLTPNSNKGPRGTPEEDQCRLEKLWLAPPRDVVRDEYGKSSGYTIRTVQWLLNQLPTQEAEPPVRSSAEELPQVKHLDTLQVPFNKITELVICNAPLVDLDDRQEKWLAEMLLTKAKQLVENNPKLAAKPADQQLLILQNIAATALNEALIEDGYQAIALNTLRVVAMEAAEDVVKAEEDNGSPSMPNFPAGLIGDIARDVQRRMTYDQPGIALATALMTMSRLSDHQFAVVAPTTGRETALNLFSIVTAPTGTGKDTVASYLDKLGHVVGDESLLGATMASPQALGRVLARRKAAAHMIVMDEIGKKLEFANSGSGAHEAAVLTTAMEIYGRALSHYSGREYAEEKKGVAAVDMPFLCIVGMSTPEALKLALTSGQIWDGFLNRFEYFPAPDELARTEKPFFGDIPEDIVNRCKRMWTGSKTGRWIDTQAMGEDKVRKAKLTIKGMRMWPINMTEEAEDAFNVFDRSHDEHRERGGAKGALLGRATERAIRIAGLVALGRENNFEQGIELKEDDARWAISWVTYSIHRMLEFVGDGLAAPSASELVEEVYKFCVDAVNDPDGTLIMKGRDKWRAYLRQGLVSKSHLTWKFKRSDPRDRAAAFETLTDAEMLIVLSKKLGGQNVKLYKPKG